ncbi:hypothetical protein L198_06827 [Cryptococcus wingfieldii CBS 7118]|uniref:Hexosyltransferase n=1 Tax=Cryptococcus wingfieldii CBS 7118 TaxID=1295528 RepID=A0A1E3IK39_9TREE|nr:hypothetical protein L198_06827 [Cryptococcus wingfieldii CBS 7118]ODN88071.1 hypothetical protein L198_06827 [Cryptococcus wingfieldii CBS 7118]
MLLHPPHPHRPHTPRSPSSHRFHFPTRRRPLLFLLCALAFLFAPVVYSAHSFLGTYKNFPRHQQYNLLLAKSPAWAHPLVDALKGLPETKGMPRPNMVHGLREGRSMEEYSAPRLSLPVEGLDGELTSPAVLMLHIFSMPSPASRERRELIRSIDYFSAIPPPYRHLVEIKFIMGRYSPGHALYDDNESREIEAEQKREKDLFILEDLEAGDNMNLGKTWEWLRQVGKEGGREAWWVMKCDDDTFPILPNLLPYLLAHSPGAPSYVGTSFGRWPGYHFYFEGMMYGFSWPVVKALAAANVSREDRNREWDEDAHMGYLMFSLPPSSSAPSDCARTPASASSAIDPCTGLHRLDLSTRLGNYRANPLIALPIPGRRGSVGVHQLKNGAQFKNVVDEVKESWEERGLEWRWRVPRELESVAEWDVDW